MALIHTDVDAITRAITDAAIAIHRRYGPGLFEGVYLTALADELARRGFLVERQKPAPVRVNGRVLKAGFKVDLLVDGAVVVELKSSEKVSAVHKKQVLTYLRLLDLPVGLLLNFGQATLMQGFRRIFNRQAFERLAPNDADE